MAKVDRALQWQFFLDMSEKKVLGVFFSKDVLLVEVQDKNAVILKMNRKSAILDRFTTFWGYGEQVLKIGIPVNLWNRWNGGILKPYRRMALKEYLTLSCAFFNVCTQINFVSYM